jgi:hypothetical protein
VITVLSVGGEFSERALLLLTFEIVFGFMYLAHDFEEFFHIKAKYNTFDEIGLGKMDRDLLLVDFILELPPILNQSFYL